jgi:pyruvate ferredoxin oxidoreductase beta subunit
VPHKLKPVEEYLARQGRFRHLFEPKRDDEVITRIQHTVDDYWKDISVNSPVAQKDLTAEAQKDV